MNFSCNLLRPHFYAWRNIQIIFKHLCNIKNIFLISSFKIKLRKKEPRGFTELLALYNLWAAAHHYITKPKYNIKCSLAITKLNLTVLVSYCDKKLTCLGKSDLHYTMPVIKLPLNVMPCHTVFEMLLSKMHTYALQFGSTWFPFKRSCMPLSHFSQMVAKYRGWQFNFIKPFKKARADKLCLFVSMIIFSAAEI